MAEERRSAFGAVDQAAILANLDLVSEDPTDSSFFASGPALVDSDPLGPPGLADESPSARKAFILYGPAGVGVAS